MKARQPSGSLSKFTATKNGKEYPAISGPRSLKNLDHWYWQFTFKISEDNTMRSKAVSVPRTKVIRVRSLIQRGAAIADILSFLGK